MDVPSGTQSRLSAHGQELVVVEVGGGIRTYRAGGRDVIDGYDESEMCSGGRGQLLAPWPNRLGDGSFEWAGRTYQTPLSEPELHNAIHGLVRWSAWTAAATGDDHLRLVHRLHPRPGWPWRLDFAVTYELSEAGLTVRTAVTNPASSQQGACPVGVGWHPYLAAFGGLVDNAELSVPAASVYRADERGLPIGRGPVAGTELDFISGRAIGASRLDTAFTDLVRCADGRAFIDFRAGSDQEGGGEGRTRLWVDTSYTHLMVYSGDTLDDPARRRRGLAVEPMTCPPNMLRSGEGRVVLDAGETFEAAWGLETSS